MNYFIYKTTNLINGKIYIGQKRAPGLAKSYLGSGTILKKAVKKYGKINFKRDILEFCLEENMNNRERYWIKFYDSTNHKIGYNITDGGEGTPGLFGAKNPFFEKEHSDKTKAILREKMAGREESTCPYCNKTMNINNAEQYHFDRCIHNPNISEDAIKMWKKRYADLKRIRSVITKCPYCDKTGTPTNMSRYHFENCEKAPILTKETINRIQSRELAKENKRKRGLKKIKVKELIECPYCNFKSISASNMKKHHFDNCKKNPNYIPIYYTCLYCDVKSLNKSNIVRFHNEKCVHNKDNIGYIIQIKDDSNISNIGIVLKIRGKFDKKHHTVIDGHCNKVHIDWVSPISKEDFDNLEPRNKEMLKHKK
jgi:group I intron endonuclease